MKRVCVRNILSVCDCTCLSKFGHVFHPFIRRSMSIDVIAGNNDDDDEVKEDVPWSSPLVHPFWSMVRSIASDRIIFRGCVIKFDLYSTDHCRRLQWSSSCRGHFPTRHTRRRRRARGHSNWPSHPSHSPMIGAVTINWLGHEFTIKLKNELETICEEKYRKKDEDFLATTDKPARDRGEHKYSLLFKRNVWKTNKTFALINGNVN